MSGPKLLSFSRTIGQEAFSTVALNVGDWLYCMAIASSVLCLTEISKAITRARGT